MYLLGLIPLVIQLPLTHKYCLGFIGYQATLNFMLRSVPVPTPLIYGQVSQGGETKFFGGPYDNFCQSPEYQAFTFSITISSENTTFIWETLSYAGNPSVIFFHDSSQPCFPIGTQSTLIIGKVKPSQILKRIDTNISSSQSNLPSLQTGTIGFKPKSEINRLKSL